MLQLRDQLSLACQLSLKTLRGTALLLGVCDLRFQLRDGPFQDLLFALHSLQCGPQLPGAGLQRCDVFGFRHSSLLHCVQSALELRDTFLEPLPRRVPLACLHAQGLLCRLTSLHRALQPTLGIRETRLSRLRARLQPRHLLFQALFGRPQLVMLSRILSQLFLQLRASVLGHPGLLFVLSELSLQSRYPLLGLTRLPREVGSELRSPRLLRAELLLQGGPRLPGAGQFSVEALQACHLPGLRL